MRENIFPASAVEIDGRALLIQGPVGSGKSSLALALIDRGARLIGDDHIILRQTGGRLSAFPHDNIKGLLEVRNVGIISLDPVSDVAVALVVQLSPDAPRITDEISCISICDQLIPCVMLWPDCAQLHLRAEWALKLHGLQFSP